jgi:hypothetical protein
MWALFGTIGASIAIGAGIAVALVISIGGVYAFMTPPPMQ